LIERVLDRESSKQYPYTAPGIAELRPCGTLDTRDPCHVGALLRKVHGRKYGFLRSLIDQKGR